MQLQPSEHATEATLRPEMPDSAATEGRERTARAAAARILDQEACLALLCDRRWGVLSVVDAIATRPYAVPVAYAFDGEVIYIATSDGRKLRALERNPALCLTVMDVDDVKRWQTVVVIGSARWLKGPGQRARAIRAFAAQQLSPDGGAFSSADAAWLIASRTFSIQVEHMSGRIAGRETEPTRLEQLGARARVAPAGTDAAAPAQFSQPQPTPDNEAEGQHSANAAMDAVRRVVRALRTSNAATEETFRLSAAQLFMLSQIALQPKQSLSDVACRTLTSQSSASEVLTKLVRRGLVSRQVSPVDRRRIEFSLSEDGARLLELAPETVPERLVAGFMTLPPEQRQSLARGLDAWIASAGLNDVPPTMFMEEARGT